MYKEMEIKKVGSRREKGNESKKWQEEKEEGRKKK